MYLKNYWKSTKGAGIAYKLRELKWELIYAAQRAWRGYSEQDIINISGSFIEKMEVVLPAFKEYYYWYWNNLEGTDILSKEDSDKILDEMIEAFKGTDDNYLMEKDNFDTGFDSVSCEDIFKNNPKSTYEERKVYYDKAYENEKKALELFVKWFNNF